MDKTPTDDDNPRNAGFWVSVVLYVLVVTTTFLGSIVILINITTTDYSTIPLLGGFVCLTALLFIAQFYAKKAHSMVYST